MYVFSMIVNQSLNNIYFPNNEETYDKLIKLGCKDNQFDSFGLRYMQCTGMYLLLRDMEISSGWDFGSIPPNFFKGEFPDE